MQSEQGSRRWFAVSGMVAGLLLCLSSLAYGQGVVEFHLRVDAKQATVGSQIQAVLNARIDAGWHLYSMTQPPGGPVPTSISVEENPVFAQAGPVKQPPVKTWFDENFGIESEYFEGDVDFRIPVKVSPKASPGTYSVPVKVTFMVCSDTLCLPPRTLHLKTSLPILSSEDGSVSKTPGAAGSVGGGRGRLETAEKELKSESEPSQPATGGRSVSTQEKPRAETSRSEKGTEDSNAPSPAVPVTGAGGSRSVPGVSDNGAASSPNALIPSQHRTIPVSTLAYVWFAMVVGGLALLTPCVFPMIPITVSYFTKGAASRSRALWEASLYSVGIVLTFTVIGFVLTFLFGAGGISRLATNPFMNLVIALIFIVFALSLFGVMEIRLPSRWVNAINRKSTGGGALGILLMALTFSLTSFTCTVPFVGTVMVAATKGDWLWSLMGITAFAVVFAAPFFFLALFPSWLQSLPKSGNWMNSVKITMAFLELAAALKFLSSVDLVYQWEILTRPVFITVWLSIALVTVFYLLGKFNFPHEVPTPSLGAVRVLFAILFLAVSFYLLRGLFGFPLGELDAFLPPRDYGNPAPVVWMSGQQTQVEEEEWLSSYPAALSKARDENRPIFIDFTGYTCTNCRWMETNIFVVPEVKKLFSQYVLVRLYTDGRKPEHRENARFEQARFQTIALPLYAIMSPQDEIITTFPGLSRNKEEFIGFLSSGLDLWSRTAQQVSLRSSEKPR